MASQDVVEWLTGIVFGGVAITTAALQNATDGEELTFTQWRAMLFVGEDDEGCRVGEVANLLDAALPATSRLLHRLERRGLMRLEPDQRDHRATRACLTGAGFRVRAAVLAYRRDEIATIVDGVRPPVSSHRTLRDLARGFDARGHAGSGPGRGRAAKDSP